MNDRRKPPNAIITRLVGVYDADGTWRGELSYWVGAQLGSAHCSLCDITHGRFRERPGWRRARAGLPVPFVTFHRDDQPDQIRALLDASLPAICAETNEGPQLLLGPERLADCTGDPIRLVDELSSAALELNLGWPAPFESER